MDQETTPKKAKFPEMSFEDFTGGNASTPSTPELELPDAPEIPEFSAPENNDDIFGDLEPPTDEAGGLDFDDFGADPEGWGEPMTRKEHVNPEKWKRAGRLFATMLDALVPTAASMYSGASKGSYKMDRDSKSDLEEAAAAYFETIDWEPSAHAQFYTVLLGVIGPTAYKAYDDKQRIAKENVYREQRARAEMIAAQKGPESPEAFEAIVEARKAKPKRDRNQFQVDAEGYYETAPLSKGGHYIQKEDRTEKAPAEILEVIADGKARGYSKGQINKECRIFLYGDPKPVK